MDKDKQALKDFLGDLATSSEADLNLGGAEADDNTDAETPAEEVEKLPFHKIKEDPRFQRYVEKEINRKMKDYQPTREAEFNQDVREDSSLVDAFTQIIGNDTPEKLSALKALKNSIESMETRTKKAEEASQYVEESRKVLAEEKESIDFLNEGLEDIEDNFGVDLSSDSPKAKKMRNDYLDYLGKASPKNEYGKIKEYADMNFTFEEFMSKQKPERNDQAKQIAARGMSRSSTVDGTAPIKRITFENWKEIAGLE